MQRQLVNFITRIRKITLSFGKCRIYFDERSIKLDARRVSRWRSFEEVDDDLNVYRFPEDLDLIYSKGLVFKL